MDHHLPIESVVRLAPDVGDLVRKALFAQWQRYGSGGDTMGPTLRVLVPLAESGNEYSGPELGLLAKYLKWVSCSRCNSGIVCGMPEHGWARVALEAIEEFAAEVFGPGWKLAAAQLSPPLPPPDPHGPPKVATPGFVCPRCYQTKATHLRSHTSDNCVDCE